MAEAQARSCTLVRTRPLPAADIVTTRPPAAGQLAGASAPVKIVQTTATSGRFRVINDEELLALLGSHPAALIRTGPHSEELVFANPADAKGFPPN
ncbi:MAG: hypothetical protein KGJ60_07040 [Verrucomicrobiota bacterium]|nr:hypothetical protein [Verrucomicrobiota bacterium]